MATGCLKRINAVNTLFLQEFAISVQREYSRRNPKPVHQPKYITLRYGINYFKYRGTKIWNRYKALYFLATTQTADKNIEWSCV